MSKITQLKCPCCGGALSFDALQQVVKCPFCDSRFTTAELQKYDDELNAPFDDKTEITGADETLSPEELEMMNAFICDSCGGEIIAGPNTAATSCPYCGNPVMIKSRLTKGYKPRYVIPFKKVQEDAVTALSQHVKKKPLLPRPFKDENKINEIKAIYVPYWLYDADIDARITYNATIVRRWSDSQADYEETSHYLLVREGNIAFDHVPVDGASSIPNDLTESIEPYDFDQRQAFSTSYLAGFLADKFDVTAQECAPRAVERMKNGTKEAFRTTVQGYDTVTTKSVNVRLFNTHYDYALYPMYILGTMWRDKKYTFAMNGQTGKMVGNLPVSKPLYAMWLSIFFLVLGGLLGTLAGISVNAMEYDSYAVVISVIFGVLLGLIIALIIMHVMRKKNKSVGFQYSSSAYYRNGSMHLNVCRDIFLYKNVIRHERNTDHR